MRVFVTGATSFIGTELVSDLIGAGHHLRGLTRSDATADHLRAIGAEPHPGSLEDRASLRTDASGMDAVAHLAFGIDMAKFAENSALKIEAIETTADTLEPGKLKMVTSGLMAIAHEPGQLPKETDLSGALSSIPRRPDQTFHAQSSKGLHVGVVSMSQIHDTGKQGLVQFLVQIARVTGVCVYIDDGASRWAACSLGDGARLYLLVLKKNAANSTYHAVAEEGVTLRKIAEVIGTSLRVPVMSLSREEAARHFGPVAALVGIDLKGTRNLTPQVLGLTPTGPTLIEDLSNMNDAA